MGKWVGGQMRKWLGMGAVCQCSSCFHLADLLGHGGRRVPQKEKD
jgi:hypothetical protein